MQMRLLGIISVGSDVTDQLLITYIFCIRQILEKKWDYNKTGQRPLDALDRGIRDSQSRFERHEEVNIYTPWGIASRKRKQ
jgi:hypothetical protein